MQRAFTRGLRLRRRRGCGRLRGCFGRFRGLRRRGFGRQFSCRFLGVLLLLGLALCRLRLLLLDLFLLAGNELLALLFLRCARRELFRRDQRGRRRRSGRFLDDRRRFLVALHEDAFLAHLDLDRAGLAHRSRGLDFRGLLARQRDLLLRLAGRTMLLPQEFEQLGLVDLGQLVAFLLAGNARPAELLQQRDRRDLEFGRELFDCRLRHALLRSRVRLSAASPTRGRPHSARLPPVRLRTNARGPS